MVSKVPRGEGGWRGPALALGGSLPALNISCLKPSLWTKSLATSTIISFSDPKKKALQRECCPHGVIARHFIFASICFQPCFSATICDLVLSKFRRRLSPFCKAVVDFNWAPQGHVDRVPPWPGLGKVHRKKLVPVYSG